MTASASSLAEQTATFPLLRETRLREYLSEAQLKEMERFCRAMVRKPGATIFRQGEPAETFFLLVEGSVELRARPPGRRVYRTVEIVRASCSFGDEALLGEPEYLTSARALERVELLALSGSAFDRVTASQPAIATGILRCAGSCLVASRRRSAILTQAPAEVGLRLLLTELAGPGDRGGRSTPLRITHAQLAGALHLSRETVSRILSQMEEEGTVKLGRGMISVLAD
jgi:CRP-like cAMP-binding protein